MPATPAGRNARSTSTSTAAAAQRRAETVRRSADGWQGRSFPDVNLQGGCRLIWVAFGWIAGGLLPASVRFTVPAQPATPPKRLPQRQEVCRRQAGLGRRGAADRERVANGIATTVIGRAQAVG